jgi:hypothetical protein
MADKTRKVSTIGDAVEESLKNQESTRTPSSTVSLKNVRKWKPESKNKKEGKFCFAFMMECLMLFNISKKTIVKQDI